MSLQARFVALIALAFVVGGGAASLLALAPLSARQAACSLLAAACSLVASGMMVAELAREARGTRLPAAEISSYTLTLSDDATRLASGGYALAGRLESIELTNGAVISRRDRIRIYDAAREYEWGALLKVRGGFSLPPTHPDAFSGSGEPGGIRQVGWHHPLFLERARLRRWIEARTGHLAPDDSALLRALLIGCRDDLASSETYFFRRAGAVHLLALSGLHLAVLSALLLHTLGPLFGRRKAVVVAAFVLVFYLFVAGPKISLIRAVIMFCLYAAARTIGRPVRGLDLLALAFVCCTLTAPGSTSSLSFQLSFLALAGILTVGRQLDRAAAPYLPGIVRLPLAASVAAQIFTAPVLAGSFGVLYPVGIASALILTPLVTAYMWGGLAFVLLPFAWVGPLERVAAQGMAILHQVIVGSAELFARAPVLRIANPWHVYAGTALCILIFAAAALLRRAHS
ncbi:MAG TPA: ComEC/Rec2 family competence protein [Spirochaetia bacterium]|nr:ComEC/Rec2 family competence protein [Spirochaetia bacterium]